MAKRKLAQLWSIIRRLDLSEAQKDIADDLKKGSYAMWALWFLSDLTRFSIDSSVVLKVFGVEAQAIKVTPWVSWLLLAAAITLYVVQAILRVKLHAKAQKAGKTQVHGNKRTSRPNEGNGNANRRRSDAAPRGRNSPVQSQENRPRR